MKNLSIKLQLTVWYTFIILIISVILFISFYIVTQRSILTEIDRSLLSHASPIAENIGLNTDNVFDDQTDEIITVSKIQVPGIFLEVTDVNGHIVGKENESAVLQNLAEQAIKTGKSAYSNKKIGTIDLRIISQPIISENKVIGTIVMGHPIEGYTNAFEQLKSTLFLLIMFFIAPSIALGYFLSQNAVSPVVILSKRISQITEENLSERDMVPLKSSETFTLVENFNNLLDRLKDAFSKERQFIGDVAHEIKTPLAVIKSNAEVTLSKKRNIEEYEMSLNQVLEHVNKLTKNLSHLIDFAWSQTTDITKQFTKLNLSELLTDICENSRYLAQAKNLNVECNIKENINIMGKKEKLNQVFMNLIDNAVKFTNMGGSIYIKLYSENKKAVVEVKDTGMGINKEDIKTIFNRFSRSKDNDYIQGHGLGLAIAKAIIKAHNGTIEAESEKGKGATFKIILKESS